MKRRLGFCLYLLIILAIIFAGLWVRFLFVPIVSDNGLHFVLKPGTTAVRFAYELQDQGELHHPRWFLWLLRYRGDAHKLVSGEYQLAANSTPSQVLDQVTKGSDIYHAFIVVNGWTIYQVMDELNHDPNVQHTLKGKTLKQIAKAMKLKQKSPEGWLYPNTYFYRWGVSDLTLLNRAHQAMQTYLTKVYPLRKKGLPYRSSYQALIVASLVEKETAQPGERAMIAGIILKRLKMWMHLQIDASVIYGKGPGFQGSLNRSDLRQKTPYNLYTKYGLPPTPIAMPGPASIQAALHPKRSNNLYYVAKGGGAHVFSKTLKGQRKAIKKYLLSQ